MSLMDAIHLMKWRFAIAGILKVLRFLIIKFAPNTRLARGIQRLPRTPHIPMEWEISRFFFLSLLKWWRGPPDRLALRASPLRKFPPEIIRCIADHLPPESAASFTISCYHLYSHLEVQYLQPLREAERSVVNQFLNLLERDLPEHILCRFCNKLHSMAFAKSHLPSSYDNVDINHWLPCWKAYQEHNLGRTIHPQFSPTIFRMAMKSHRQGSDTSKLIRLLSYETEAEVWIGSINQISAMTRINNGSLLMRKQSIFITPSSQETPLPGFGGIEICRHIFGLTMLRFYELGIDVPLSAEIDTFKNRQGIIYCNHCHCEFRVDFLGYGEDGNAMVVTQWMDLGKHDDDPKWTVRDWKYAMTAKRKRHTVDFRRGSICGAFEQRLARKFELDSQLIARVEKDLRLKPRPRPDLEISFDGARLNSIVEHGRLVRV